MTSYPNFLEQIVTGVQGEFCQTFLTKNNHLLRLLIFQKEEQKRKSLGSLILKHVWNVESG